jgi:hypothetical protein
MSFLTEELKNKKRMSEKEGKSFSKEDRVILRENLESLRPENHAYSDDDGKCWYCGMAKEQHKKVVMIVDGKREVRRVA